MGMDINFKKIIKKLEKIHHEFPDLRFGHVVQASIDQTKLKANCDLHDYSSKEILSSLESFKESTKNKRKR